MRPNILWRGMRGAACVAQHVRRGMRACVQGRMRTTVTSANQSASPSVIVRRLRQTGEKCSCLASESFGPAQLPFGNNCRVNLVVCLHLPSFTIKVALLESLHGSSVTERLNFTLTDAREMLCSAVCCDTHCFNCTTDDQAPCASG